MLQKISWQNFYSQHFFYSFNAGIQYTIKDYTGHCMMRSRDSSYISFTANKLNWKTITESAWICTCITWSPCSFKFSPLKTDHFLYWLINNWSYVRNFLALAISSCFWVFFPKGMRVSEVTCWPICIKWIYSDTVIYLHLNYLYLIL